jgi:uncharacterized DUF497 family protein
VKFEWDPEKSQTNLNKHDISFNEAQTVFDDPLAYIFNDEWNSIGEPRELIIGHSSNHRLLIVSFTQRTLVNNPNNQFPTNNG